MMHEIISPPNDDAIAVLRALSPAAAAAAAAAAVGQLSLALLQWGATAALSSQGEASGFPGSCIIQIKIPGACTAGSMQQHCQRCPTGADRLLKGAQFSGPGNVRADPPCMHDDASHHAFGLLITTKALAGALRLSLTSSHRLLVLVLWGAKAI